MVRLLQIQVATFPALMTALTKWKSTLDSMLTNISLNTSLIENVALAEGANVINHKLGIPLTGYRIVRNSASATFYDTQDNNPTPSLTLQLTASAATTVSIEVF